MALLAIGLFLLASAVTAHDQFGDNEDDFAPTSQFDEALYYRLPPGFLIGASSSAYQVEGAWNEDGKGESIQDYFYHVQRPELANGDVASDLYHKYKEDVHQARQMKLDFYRLSFSWPRLLPDGTTNNINQAGVDFYNNFIDELIRKGVMPLVTIYHWDLPQALQLKGGWYNPAIQDYFREYAEFVFKTFGDRVKWWATVNEPHIFCSYGYENAMLAPGISDPGVGPYKCMHNMVLAHAKAYHAYKENYSYQNGQVGFSQAMAYYFVPRNVTSQEDRAAAQRAIQFAFAWFVDPVMFGRYPEVMRETIDANSLAEGRNESRLPSFTEEEKAMLQSATDFIGVNHYLATTVTPGVPEGAGNPSMDRDIAVIRSTPEKWLLGPFNHTRTPWAMRATLNWIKDRYSNFPMFITENGYGGDLAEGLNDHIRISFISEYLRATLRAVNEDGCHVLGYTVWALTDDFEWTNGFKWKAKQRDSAQLGSATYPLFLPRPSPSRTACSDWRDLVTRPVRYFDIS